MGKFTGVPIAPTAHGRPVIPHFVDDVEAHRLFAEAMAFSVDVVAVASLWETRLDKSETSVDALLASRLDRIA